MPPRRRGAIVCRGPESCVRPAPEDDGAALRVRNGGVLRQVGPAATRAVRSHVTVALAPGATAHAILGGHEWGAICTKPAASDGLLVYPPGHALERPSRLTGQARLRS